METGSGGTPAGCPIFIRDETRGMLESGKETMGTINNFGNVLLPAGSTHHRRSVPTYSALAARASPLTLSQQQQTNLQIQSAAMQTIAERRHRPGNRRQALTDTNGASTPLPPPLPIRTS